MHSETDQHDPADRDWRAEARERLQQCAEAERDHHDLHPDVVGDRRERTPENAEVPRGLCHVEDPQGVDNDPHDRPEAEHRPSAAESAACPIGIE
jgi:hypothetical protein